MDKQIEREQLARVFGAAVSTARDHERPDFLFSVGERIELGVEVTAVYANNADAKLKLVPGYTDSLLNKKRSIHRADAGLLRVDDLTLLKPDGEVVETLTGIIQELPSKKSAYDILFAKIAEKEGKAHEYLQSCDRVDLIVEDGSSLFRHQTHEEFYKAFFPLISKTKLIGSKFREIHLITGAAGLQRVSIPLIANVFFADCYAYEHLLQPSIELGRASEEIFRILAACLWHDGYDERVKMVGGSDGVGIFCGAWELFYAEDGKKLRDWTAPGMQYQGEPLNEVIKKMPTQLIDEARALSLSRPDWFAAIDVRLPTYET